MFLELPHPALFECLHGQCKVTIHADRLTADYGCTWGAEVWSILFSVIPLASLIMILLDPSQSVKQGLLRSNSSVIIC